MIKGWKLQNKFNIYLYTNVIGVLSFENSNCSFKKKYLVYRWHNIKNKVGKYFLFIDTYVRSILFYLEKNCNIFITFKEFLHGHNVFLLNL